MLKCDTDREEFRLAPRYALHNTFFRRAVLWALCYRGEAHLGRGPGVDSRAVLLGTYNVGLVIREVAISRKIKKFGLQNTTNDEQELCILDHAVRSAIVWSLRGP